MNFVLERLYDEMPHADVETERLLLGALVVCGQDRRNEVTLLITANTFHDAFNRWLFIALRSARTRSTTEELLRHVYDYKRPDWIGANLGWWIAQLVVRRDASSCCGLVKRIAMYCEDLLRLQRLRDKVNSLENQMIQLLAKDNEHGGG